MNGSWNGKVTTGVLRLWNRGTLKESTIWPWTDSTSTAEGGAFSSSVALSSDGQLLAVGAPSWSGGSGGSLAGVVQIFIGDVL